MYSYRNVLVSVIFISFISFMQQLVFSVSTFADAHCKSHNLLLSWRRYMNCVHSELKFLVTGSSEISSALIRTHGTYLRFSLALIRTHTTGAKPPKTGPHSCRTHVFSSLSCKADECGWVRRKRHNAAMSADECDLHESDENTWVRHECGPVLGGLAPVVWVRMSASENRK